MTFDSFQVSALECLSNLFNDTMKDDKTKFAVLQSMFEELYGLDALLIATHSVEPEVYQPAVAFVQQFFPSRNNTNLSEDLIDYSESSSEDDVLEA